MSYAIVSKIKIMDDKVLITSADNNVLPRTQREWECHSLSRLLQERGKEAVELEIMKDYENGNMQAGAKNKYTRALEVLLHMPEYREFNWRGRWNAQDGVGMRIYEDNQKNRIERIAEFEALLLRAMRTQLPRARFAITKDINGVPAYFNHRRGSRRCRWYYDPERATRFNYAEDAENTKKYFTFSDNWRVVELAGN